MGEWALGWAHELTSRNAEKLCRLTEMEQCTFVTTGSEATTLALRLCRPLQIALHSLQVTFSFARSVLFLDGPLIDSVNKTGSVTKKITVTSVDVFLTWFASRIQ